jgi:tryptophanyl-tRNA synthetase
VIAGPATRVMSLKDAGKKMSKSDPSEGARILLMDDADQISKKIKRATTDPEPLPSEEAGLKGRLEADNLVGIYAALSDTTKAAVLQQFGGQGWGAFKPALAELAVEKLAPIAAEVRRMLGDPGFVDAFMKDGAERASVIAEQTMKQVRSIVGFVR